MRKQDVKHSLSRYCFKHVRLITTNMFFECLPAHTHWFGIQHASGPSGQPQSNRRRLNTKQKQLSDTSAFTIEINKVKDNTNYVTMDRD